jgi:hypothetical protein
MPRLLLLAGNTAEPGEYGAYTGKVLSQSRPEWQDWREIVMSRMFNRSIVQM